MNGGVLELVFLFVIENNAFGVDEVQDGDPPDGAVEELDNEVIHPFLG